MATRLVACTNRDKTWTMIVDSIELEMCSCGEWIDYEWKVKRRFSKLHVLVDEESVLIHATAVTDEQTGDPPILRELVGC